MKSLVPVVAALVSAPALAQVSVPQQLAYEGRLAALDGTPSSGIHSIKLAIWPALTGSASNPLWSDTLSVTVVNGLYSVTLGTTTGNPLPPTLFDGTVRYLELTIDSDVLSPRQSIGSVPYSILSGGVQGGPVDATSYALNGEALVNNAGRTLISLTPDGGTTSVTSVTGVYCGATPIPYSGQIIHQASGATSYRATKLICQDVCNNSPTAHMCAGSELRRTLELGGSLPASVGGLIYLWYSSDVSSGGANPSYDCFGWTSNTGSVYQGGAWYLSTPSPNEELCATMLPIACCD